MGVGSFGRGWRGLWGDGATPSVVPLGSFNVFGDISGLGRVLRVGSVAVAGQDFTVGHQLPLDVAGVEGVADEAAGAVFYTAALVRG